MGALHFTLKVVGKKEHLIIEDTGGESGEHPGPPGSKATVNHLHALPKLASWCGESLRTSMTPVVRTPKGAYSPRGRSRPLLETPFSEHLLRTLLRTLFYCKRTAGPLLRKPF